MSNMSYFLCLTWALWWVLLMLRWLTLIMILESKQPSVKIFLEKCRSCVIAKLLAAHSFATGCFPCACVTLSHQLLLWTEMNACHSGHFRQLPLSLIQSGFSRCQGNSGMVGVEAQKRQSKGAHGELTFPKLRTLGVQQRLPTMVWLIFSGCGWRPPKGHLKSGLLTTTLLSHRGGTVNYNTAFPLKGREWKLSIKTQLSPQRD